MDPEQDHGGNTDLGQAHDAPGTLHHRQPPMQARTDAVKAVQDLTFGQARRKLPLPILSGLSGIKPVPGAAEGTPVGVLEADGDTPLEETRALLGPGLEESGQHRREQLLIRPLIQTQGRRGDDIQVQSLDIEMAMHTQAIKARTHRR